MRTAIVIGLLVAAIPACSSDNAAPGPDAQTGNHPPPRVISGGGIGDGAIDGVVNLYVIDDATRTPVVGATVRVGGIDGTTDPTGLFIANNVAGPQTVVVRAANYRSELWLGANGANMTIDLNAAVDPVPTSASLSGAITGFGAITVPANHRKAASVVYSQDDKLGDAANNIATTGNTNFCDTIGAAACTFTVTSRTGTVGLVAALYDHDTKGTASPADDTFTLIGWATRTGITVANGVAQSGQDLTIVAATDLATITADFGTPPSGLPTVGAVVGIDAGTSGTLQLFSVLTPASPSLLAPKLSAISGSTYRLTGIANNGTGPTAAQSVVLRRPLTTAPLAAGTWLAAPTGLALTRTGGSWTAVAGALVMGASYDQTVATTVTHLLNVTAFDSSTTYVIPDVVTLPAGTLDAKGTAIGATLDPMNFSADADRGKLNSFASQPVAVN